MGKLEQKYGPPKKPIVNTPYEPRVVSKYLKMSKKQEKRSKREMENDEKMAALELAYKLADKNGIPPPSRSGKGLKSKLLGLNKQLLYVPEFKESGIFQKAVISLFSNRWKVRIKENYPRR